MPELTRVMASTADSHGWRRSLRNQIVILLCAKLALLSFLWMMFFSPSHRIAADSNATSQRFGVADQRAPNPSSGASSTNPLSRRFQRD
jgi:hypothetical protein